MIELFSIKCSILKKSKIDYGQYFEKIDLKYSQFSTKTFQIPLEICELENIGVVLRFCPFENSTGKQPTSEEITSFIQCLEQQLVILKATIQHKETFIHLVDQSPVLSIVELPEWAGESFFLLHEVTDWFGRLFGINALTKMKHKIFLSVGNSK